MIQHYTMVMTMADGSERTIHGEYGALRVMAEETRIDRSDDIVHMSIRTDTGLEVYATDIPQAPDYRGGLIASKRRRRYGIGRLHRA